jgi:hypothetical protein
MLKNEGLSKISGICCLAILSLLLIGIAGAPSNSFADGSPGGVDPPPLSNPNDTTETPDGSNGTGNDYDDELPIGLEAMLTILNLTL